MSRPRQLAEPTPPPLDPAFQDPTRLRIMTMLCALEEGDEITERRLLELLGLAAEELQEELRTLREAGCVTTAEGTRGRIRGTWIGTTRSGRADFRTYVRTLEAHLVAGDGP